MVYDFILIYLEIFHSTGRNCSLVYLPCFFDFFLNTVVSGLRIICAVQFSRSHTRTEIERQYLENVSGSTDLFVT